MKARKTSINRRQYTPEERQAIVEVYEKSGLTQRAFAQEQGIGYSTLTAWLRKRKRTENPPNRASTSVPWIEIPTGEALPFQSTAVVCTLERSDGVKAKLRPGLDSGMLKAVLELFNFRSEW